MCGIFIILFPGTADAQLLRQIAVKHVRTIRHRGPDWSGIAVDEQGGAILAHERLGLVGLDNGAQPIVSADGKLLLAVNGEIYNHQKFRKEIPSEVYEFQTESDCEVIMALYRKYCSASSPSDVDPSLFLDKLEGMFSFVLWDMEKQIAVIGRDHMGIIPLYVAVDEVSGTRYYSSECKAFVGIENITSVQEFPPRCYQVCERHVPTPATATPAEYYSRSWMTALPASVPSLEGEYRESTKKAIHDALCAAVHSHLMCDTPYGVLLSGGLDSSIVSAITKKYAAMRIETEDKEQAWWPRLHSFAIGLRDAPDLKASAEVAKHLGTVHHEMHFTVQEGLDAIRDVIYHCETFDVTTIRASTPMYLLARKIKAMGIKMVLSGEGADEVFGGYLYFHKAPSAKDLHEETVRKLRKLHLYDCLRANKSMAAWGVESRVPFLDKEFLDVAMQIDPEFKMIGKPLPESVIAAAATTSASKSEPSSFKRKTVSIEKQILREAFESYLPESIAWRQKEQFGDGVGYSWIDGIKEHAGNIISDEMMSRATELFPVNTPDTKEAFWFRSMFEEHFCPTKATLSPLATTTTTSIATVSTPQQKASFLSLIPQGGKSVACSTAEALLWDESLMKRAADPSGRCMAEVHNQ